MARFFRRTNGVSGTQTGLGEARSMPEIFSSVPLTRSPRFWKRLAGFIGPGFLISVGYMDPGNWATDLAAGSRYGYTLLFVIMVSNLMAILLQSLSLKLGIAAEADLAQLCRARFGRRANFMLWIFAEVAIAACDLAEVIGSAIALQLLFHLALIWGVLITSMDVLVILLLEERGFRYVEALVMVLIATIAALFGVEIVLSRPEFAPILRNLFVPTAELITNPGMLYIGIGILGATVMPHNLYLHSSIVQSRKYERTPAGKRDAIRFANWDSGIALMLALFVNAAILVVAAAVFHRHAVLLFGLSQFILIVCGFVMSFKIRQYPLKMQDRIIRLEMRLRLQKLLPLDRHWEINGLSMSQLIALRFAGDEELLPLMRKVLDENIQDRNAIKKMIKEWEADDYRI